MEKLFPATGEWIINPLDYERDPENPSSILNAKKTLDLDDQIKKTYHKRLSLRSRAHHVLKYIL